MAIIKSNIVFSFYQIITQSLFKVNKKIEYIYNSLVIKQKKN